MVTTRVSADLACKQLRFNQLINYYYYCRDVDYVDTWKAMENLVKLGLVRSIGVSNFNTQQIERVLANCEIKPVNNQVSYHKRM